MALPPPEPGTVIRYAYLWADEQEQGREEGSKDRPCIIAVAIRRVEDRTMAVVVPVTRSPQGRNAVEIPPEVKARLGLEPGEPSWVVCSEVNEFEWPGPDLRPILSTGRWVYGMLPDALFLHIARALRMAARVGPVEGSQLGLWQRFESRSHTWAATWLVRRLCRRCSGSSKGSGAGFWLRSRT